jgi:phenylpropionate dioxygenase-like ring-hydroxylating dioxygenase large terminal subunit
MQSKMRKKIFFLICLETHQNDINTNIDAMIHLKNYWYTAVGSSALPSRSIGPISVEILDKRIVIFRNPKNNYQPVALLDRCCHRGAKLSLGKVN